MRILYLHQYFTTPDMPGGTRSFELGRRLAALGHDVQMITTDRASRGGSANWRVTEESGITVHWANVPYDNRMSYSRRLLAFTDYARRAGGKARALGGDVVLASSTPLTVALPGARAAAALGVPMVLEVRDLWPSVPIKLGALKDPVSRSAASWLESYAYRHARRIVTLAPGMRDWIVSRGYPAEKVTVIPNGCDLELFGVDASEGRRLREQTSWLGDRPLVVYAGALGKVNGVGWLVRVAHELARSHPDVRFAVVGDGRERDSVEALARELGVLGVSFFMLGSLPKREVPVWLSAATVATSLIVDEPFLWENAVTNKFFDALAAGRPIVSDHPGWQSEVATAEGAGAVLEYGDVPASAARLGGLLRDAEWLAGARAAAARLAHERFDRDILAGMLAEVLEDAVSDRA